MAAVVADSKQHDSNRDHSNNSSKHVQKKEVERLCMYLLCQHTSIEFSVGLIVVEMSDLIGKEKNRETFDEKEDERHCT